MNKFDFGKYKGIIVSIALFLLLDASVLTLNFYISYEIADDAVDVNLAGRQRMLSQRMMKSLLDIEASEQQEQKQNALAELNSTYQLFDQTLVAFDKGGETQGADGQPVTLMAANSPGSLDAIAQAKQLWQPFAGHIKDVIDSAEYLGTLDFDANRFNEVMAAAISYGQANNLKLLNVMNTLTLDLENVASSKATTLRLIQTVGISLAIINFFIILFHFIRQLRESDEKIEAARKETHEILSTVGEGLFLLDKDFVIGNQHSEELKRIFNRSDIAGQSFEDLLSDILTEKDMTTVYSFINLLFKPSINENLIGDLNPLNVVEINIPKKGGGYDNKFLRFAFSRTMDNLNISHVLVTVTDITRQVLLSKELEESRQQNEKNVEMLSVILHVNPMMLSQYIDNSYQAFNEINNELKRSVKSHKQFLDKATAIFVKVHNFKGESASLELQPFVDLAHQFEDQIDQLRDGRILSGNDFLPLAVLLDRLMSQMDAVSRITQKLLTFSNDLSSESAEVRSDWGHLQLLADAVAERQNKSVEVVTSGLNDYPLPTHFTKSLNSICLQLIRNSIAHGIETEADRLAAEKPAMGEIQIRLSQRRNGQLHFEFKDNGQGLIIEQIREKALEKGIIDERKAEQMDSKQLVSLIFSPELSTANEVDEDSGRGVGMFLVKEEIKKLRGKITISSRKGQGCGFSIMFPPQSSQEKEAA